MPILLCFAACDNGTTLTPGSEVISEYTVTFNANNGTENTTKKVSKGGKITAPDPAPVKAGYGFGGWYRDDTTFENAWDFDTGTVSGNITLYAKWNFDQYIVTFRNGETVFKTLTGVNPGDTIAEPDPAPVRAGFSFRGWYQKDSIGEGYSPWDFTRDTVNADITLYAIWMPEVEVTFNANNGTENTTKKVFASEKITVPDTNPVKENFGFDGWYRDDGTFEHAWDFDTDIVIGNITLYAKWVPSLPGMVWVARGTFSMGTDSKLDLTVPEGPVHQVTISKGFHMGKYEVTQAQYEEVMGTNPSINQGDSHLPDEGEIQANRPVERVRWFHAVAYCNKLSISEGLTPAYSKDEKTDPADWDWDTLPTDYYDQKWTMTCDWTANGYRLPTEAEWEYAAKGGNGSPGNYLYSGSDTIDDVAWYGANSGNKTHEVGKKAPNGLGLYDMSGNVYEWCWDGPVLYPLNGTDPRENSGMIRNRIFRGGFYNDSARSARSACRIHLNPAYVAYHGFRLVRPQF